MELRIDFNHKADGRHYLLRRLFGASHAVHWSATTRWHDALCTLNAVSHRLFNVSCYRSASRYAKDHHNRLRVEEKCKNQRLTFGIALWRTMHKRITVLPPPPLLHSLCQWPLRYVVVCVGSCSDHLTRGVQMNSNHSSVCVMLFIFVSAIGFSEFNQLFTDAAIKLGSWIKVEFYPIRFRSVAPHLAMNNGCGRNDGRYYSGEHCANERVRSMVTFSAAVLQERCLPIGLCGHFTSGANSNEERGSYWGFSLFQKA